MERPIGGHGDFSSPHHDSFDLTPAIVGCKSQLILDDFQRNVAVGCSSNGQYVNLWASAKKYIFIKSFGSISNYCCRVCTVARRTTASRDVPRQIGALVRYLNIPPQHFRFERGNHQLKLSADDCRQQIENVVVGC